MRIGLVDRYEESGEHDEARAVVRLRRLRPDYTIELVVQYRQTRCSAPNYGLS